jgi:hypothetical protein
MPREAGRREAAGDAKGPGAMPPLPKNPKTRQRRNRTTTAAQLDGSTAGARRRAVPDLPTMPATLCDRESGEPVQWHPLTVEWWRDAWQSPMRDEWVDADVHGLYMLAILRERFYRDPTPTNAAEIRLQEQRYGLSPIDRRRLQWEVDRGDEASERTAKRTAARKATPSSPAPGGKSDPRRRLHAVK